MHYFLKKITKASFENYQTNNFFENYFTKLILKTKPNASIYLSTFQRTHTKKEKRHSGHYIYGPKL